MSTATINRIKQYVEQPNSTTQPHTAVMYGTIVLAAMETMRGLMGGFDNELAFKAASAILELEKARLRHKLPLAGVQPNQQVGQLEAVVEPAEQLVNEAPPELSEVQMKQFEKGVDEFAVVLNRKQVEDGLPGFSRAVLREQCWKKMQKLGFEEFLTWVDLMVGRTVEVPAPKRGRSR